MMDIEILVKDFKMVDKGALRAFFTLRLDFDDLGSLEIKECRLLKDRDRRAWVSLPQRAYESSEGGTKRLRYVPLGVLDGELKSRVERVVFSKFDELEFNKRGGDERPLVTSDTHLTPS